MILSPTDIGLCVATLSLTFLLYLWGKRTRLPYPPGPKRWPVIGSLLEVPDKRQWYTYAKWSQDYASPIIYFEVLGTPIVVLNDLKTAQDLFDKRWEIYSERPRMPMLNEALAFGWNFGFSADMKHWKICRREFDPLFRQAASRAFHPQQYVMTYDLLNRLLDTPDDFMKHLRYMTGSLILDISHGISVKFEHDEYIEIAEQAQEGMERSADANIVDIIPWIFNLPAWLPGMGWKKQILVWRDWALKMRDVPYEFVKDQLDKGVAKPCIVTDLLENWKGSPSESISPEEREYIIKCIASTAYSAGSDSTVAGFNVLILATMLFPDVQRKAQEQIDRVVGHDRLPTFEDMDDLPYITAVVREILRWAASVPISVPHQSSTSDVYKGYYIPKGAMVIGNAWAILHDPEAYPDPDRFDPDRFLTPDGQLNPNVQKPESAFGFGRRQCPGRFMAFDSMWITVACLLATFTFHKPNGEPSKPEDKVFNPELFYSGLVVHCKPFKCDIRPRSDKAVKLIRTVSQAHRA